MWKSFRRMQSNSDVIHPVVKKKSQNNKKNQALAKFGAKYVAKSHKQGG